MKNNAIHSKLKFHSPYFWAFLNVLVAVTGQFLILTFNYDGNWTALFRTGDKYKVPDSLAQYTYVFHNSDGYDGQFYRYVAHDPLGIKGFKQHIDNPTIRYSRILVPGISYAIAFGRHDTIDAAYYFVILLSLFLGSLFLSKWAMLWGKHPAWGLVFLIIPATVISSWMMTCEIALLSLTAALAFFWRCEKPVGIYIVLLLSALCRETGMILAAGVCTWCVVRGEYRKAIINASALIPAAAWYGYIQWGMSGASSVLPTWVLSQPATGIFHAFLEPAGSPLADPIGFCISFLDRLSIFGLGILFFVSLLNLWRFRLSPVTLAAGLHVLLGIVVNNATFWRIPLGYTRPFSTLLLLNLLQCITKEAKPLDRWITLMPVFAVSLRIVLQLVYSEGRLLFN